MPLISICIPCYNGDRFIAATVQSVLSQTLTNYEIVIVDDASADETYSLLESFCDPRITLFRNERNLGMGRNWNKAVSHSRGKYVKLLCGDDLLHPECLERQVTILESSSNASAALAICNRQVVNSHGKILYRRKLPLAQGLTDGLKLIRRSIRYGSNIIGEPATGLFRRSVLDQGVLYRSDNPYCIDLAFWADVLRHGAAYIDPACLASFRISSSAVSARIGLRQAQAFRRFACELSKNPIYGIQPFDLALAYGLSFQWCILRNLFLTIMGGRSRETGVHRCGTIRGVACSGATKLGHYVNHHHYTLL